MSDCKILKSELDDSVNFIYESSDGGFYETRYVRRKDNYFVCYLSSHSGCNRGCKFCHLTTTKQTMMKDADMDCFLKQSYKVLSYYNSIVEKNKSKADIVHFNWMARGEPLCNKLILEDSFSLLRDMASYSRYLQLIPKFNISTIMPKGLNKSLVDIFPVITPNIYYSLYSLNEGFREKWLPSAMPVNQALKLLKEYQDVTGKIIRLHWAFIKGENDSFGEVDRIFDAIDNEGLICKFNMVRYNPYSSVYGEEPSEERLQELLHQINQRTDGRAKMITRVGQDTFCSCGCFIERD